MNKDIQPKVHLVKFKCASCGTEYEILSTTKGDTVGIDVCSVCHPFFKGTNSDQKAKGRAEKFASKFDAGLATSKSKVEKKTSHKKENKKQVGSLEDLQ
jgi:large subunit ribosomal protein L31